MTKPIVTLIALASMTGAAMAGGLIAAIAVLLIIIGTGSG